MASMATQEKTQVEKTLVENSINSVKNRTRTIQEKTNESRDGREIT
jgi:hypothetical protein